MMASVKGRIINISLDRGIHRLQRALGSNSATKASLIGFTRSLAREVGQLGINVNAHRNPASSPRK